MNGTLTVHPDEKGKVTVVQCGGQPIYRLQPKQLQAYKQTPVYAGHRGVKYLGYGGAAGGGKSHLLRAVFTAGCQRWPGSTYVIFRQTDEEVLENHYIPFRNELPTHIWQDGVRLPFYTWNGKEKAFTFPLWGNSRILLRFLRHDDDVFKRQGAAFDGIGFEESTHYTWFQISWLLGNRLRSTVNGTIPFALFPSNPGNIGHFWYKRLFIDRKYRENERPEDYAFLQAFLRDNTELMERDPSYALKLDLLPEPWRSWVRDGNWSAGAGMALPQLDRRVHLVPHFEIPNWWPRFGSFDWGYGHPFSFGEYAVTEDGDVFKVQTVTGRHLQPRDIAERIRARVDVTRLKYIHAGHDCWNERKAEGANAPSIQEQFSAQGVYLSKANIDRIQGVNNLRAYLDFQHTGPDGSEGDPGLRFLDNPGNQRCVEQLEAMVTDPDDIEDVLKVDADDTGEGGDDIYDETRYAIASRPNRAPQLFNRRGVRAFSKEALAADVQRLYRREDSRPRLPEKGLPPIHPEFGDVF